MNKNIVLAIVCISLLSLTFYLTITLQKNGVCASSHTVANAEFYLFDENLSKFFPESFFDESQTISSVKDKYLDNLSAYEDKMIFIFKDVCYYGNHTKIHQVNYNEIS